MNIPERKRARGEMLPLLDVIFMLMVLFIFMLIQMRPDFGMSVELPQVGESPATQEQETDKTKIWVSVDAKNAFFVNKENIPNPAGVIPALQRMANAPAEKVQVIFKGDRQADFGLIIEIFNEMRGAGYTDVLFDVNRTVQNGSEK